MSKWDDDTTTGCLVLVAIAALLTAACHYGGVWAGITMFGLLALMSALRRTG